ncbi:MAG: DUF2098 domain-containing protein [Methanimicrococcus sp.]|nr:DUF2098 domain-containing protein [Methanimicrococcus sp.]
MRKTKNFWKFYFIAGESFRDTTLLNSNDIPIFMSKLQTVDIHGRNIKVGDFVKYINTGTVGEILEMMEDEEGVWAFLSSTELYYKIDFLELTGEFFKKEAKRRDLEADIEEKIRIQEEAVESLQNVESRDAPGGAG